MILLSFRVCAALRVQLHSSVTNTSRDSYCVPRMSRPLWDYTYCQQQKSQIIELSAIPARRPVYTVYSFVMF